MGTVINYELLKEVVSREEQIIREEIEVEDIGNFCVRAYTVKGSAEYLCINTDDSGWMYITSIVGGAIKWKIKDHYDINLILSTTQAFLKNHPTVMVITKKDFIKVLGDTIKQNCVVTMREADIKAEPLITE